jgi:hypothetical protein
MAPILSRITPSRSKMTAGRTGPERNFHVHDGSARVSEYGSAPHHGRSGAGSCAPAFSIDQPRTASSPPRDHRCWCCPERRNAPCPATLTLVRSRVPGGRMMGGHAHVDLRVSTVMRSWKIGWADLARPPKIVHADFILAAEARLHSSSSARFRPASPRRSVHGAVVLEAGHGMKWT